MIEKINNIKTIEDLIFSFNMILFNLVFPKSGIDISNFPLKIIIHKGIKMKKSNANEIPTLKFTPFLKRVNKRTCNTRMNSITNKPSLL